MFFDDGEDVKAYVHIAGQKMFEGERTSFTHENFDHKSISSDSLVGLRILDDLFRGAVSYFDVADIFETGIELRIDRTHEIARRYIFGARRERRLITDRMKERCRFMRLLCFISDKTRLEHLKGTEERAKNFFKEEIERAIINA